MVNIPSDAAARKVPARQTKTAAVPRRPIVRPRPTGQVYGGAGSRLNGDCRKSDLRATLEIGAGSRRDDMPRALVLSFVAFTAAAQVRQSPDSSRIELMDQWAIQSSTQVR